MYKTKPLARAVSLALATSALGLSPQALAQQQVETDEEIEEIVTTGSRIRKDSFSSASPVEVVFTEKAAVSGTPDLGDLMQSSTIAAGAPGYVSHVHCLRAKRRTRRADTVIAWAW